MYFFELSLIIVWVIPIFLFSKDIYLGPKENKTTKVIHSTLVIKKKEVIQSTLHKTTTNIWCIIEGARGCTC